jgi:hypothetical protein
MPGWTWTPLEDDWSRNLDRLRSFVDREGIAQIAQSHVEDGFRLGAWVTRQRLEHRRGELSEVRAAHLEALPGWTWNSVEDRWTTGLEHLRTYLGREGHAQVRALHREGSTRSGPGLRVVASSTGPANCDLIESRRWSNCLGGVGEQGDQRLARPPERTARNLVRALGEAHHGSVVANWAARRRHCFQLTAASLRKE